jgi:auxin efflux carrier (AEC)
MLNSYINAFIPLVAIIFLGYFAKRIGILSLEDVKPLNNIVFKIALPCLIFTSLYSANLSDIPYILDLTLTGLIGGVVTGLIAFLILTYKKIAWSKKWSLILPVTMGQTAFLGYPLIKGIWGKEALVMGEFYDISTWIIFVALNIILVYWINNGVNKENVIGTDKTVHDGYLNKDGVNKKNVISVVKKVISLPILWAVAFGIILNLIHFDIGMDSTAGEVLNFFKNIGPAIVMVLLGLTLDFNRLRENFKILTGISIIKLVVFPFIVFICVYVMGLQGIRFDVPIVQSIMPCAIIALALSIEYDLDHKLTSDCIIISMILSSIIIPIILTFIC